MLLLLEHGHTPFLVHPTLKEIDKHRVSTSCKDIDSNVDTITMYIRAELQDKIRAEIIALSPTRVIFNPGTENLDFENVLLENDIKVQRDCTLILLQTATY